MNISVENLALPGLALIHSRRLEDERGYFMETWSEQAFARLGLIHNFVQENQSLSLKRFTLRGLHFQMPPFEQAKLVRVLKGQIFDVAVDLRPSSPTFRRWHSTVLSASNGQQILVPRGFAHGFLSLEDETLVAYKVDAPYMPSHENGLHWIDPSLAIEWPVDANSVILSSRDQCLPTLQTNDPVQFVV